ncbi:28 kDa heat- and acid-stable phosphoprotein-like [Hermetia illucens]|uniref:28 kDa heat- and acid-stable phosphoprotein-like n=1 Tax=Hermetia illucens TaxID=343691 RepID=UPI0018CC4A57|nr:28 kDa heat- and acid-stable phosphoprotein-like [Hermetia illucens]
MPRGKYVNHKGRSRNFTSPEELEEEMKKDKEKTSRQQEESEGEDEEASGGSRSGSDSEESDDDNHKAKGVSNLIEIENPNRVAKKSAVKVSKVGSGDKAAKPELSRREREELEKQKAQLLYQKLHAEGKTEQARADLARLAIIKQHRAEAAARREAEKKEKEERKKGGTSNR